MVHRRDRPSHARVVMQLATTSPPSGHLIDRLGRPVRSLRVSITDRCNLRCRYCMPADADDFFDRDDVLTYEQIVRTVQVANRLGIDNVRITGGEPLLRRDVDVLIRMLRDETDTRDLSLTTNALLLEKHAARLRDAGLQRLNISLDSLHPERFERMTRLPLLDRAWRGIDAAIEAGFSPLKINAVILSGYNDDEVDDWVELTRERDLVVRLLELMPIGEGAGLTRLGGFHDLTATRERLQRSHGLEPASLAGNGPARYWRLPGGRGAIGFITPISNRYCDTCTRMRLTSTGEIRPCLAYDVQVDAGAAIRAGSEADIELALRRATEIKPEGHHWDVGQVTKMGMSKLGG